MVFGVQSGAYKRADPEFNSTNQHPVHVSVHLLNHTWTLHDIYTCNFLVTSFFFFTFNHKTSVIHLSQTIEFTSLISDSVHCFYTTTSNELWTTGGSKYSYDSGMGTYMYTCTCSTLILVPDWYKKSGVTGFLENSKTRL